MKIKQTKNSKYSTINNESNKKTNLLIVTQDDFFYVPIFIDTFFRKLDQDSFRIVKIILLKPFNESLIELIKRMYLFYGFKDFLRRGTEYFIEAIYDKSGRSNRSIRKMARERGIELKTIVDINDKSSLDELRKDYLDIVLSVSAPQIFQEEMLAVPKWGCINVHSSKLPMYRGALPSFWAMYNDESNIGVTIHTMDKEVDKGKIILQDEISISEEDSLDDVIKKLKSKGAELAVNALEQIRNGNEKLKDYKGRTSYYNFPKKQHLLRFKKSGKKLL